MTLLSLKDLVKSHASAGDGRREVIRVGSFQMAQGEWVALEGPSGTGKSTLLNLIAGIIRPDSGQILFDGLAVHALKESELDRMRASRLGYAFQSFNLLQGFTALENVALARLFAGNDPEPHARELLDKLGLGRHLGHKPHQLSVGKQQRVALARALVNRPKLLLADEPTGNLDPEAARAAVELMKKICGEMGTAILLVTHDPALLAGWPRVEKLLSMNRPRAAVEEVR